MTVDQLLEELKALQGEGLGDSIVLAYEGEKTGILVARHNAEIAFFPTSQDG